MVDADDFCTNEYPDEVIYSVFSGTAGFCREKGNTHDSIHFG